MANFPTDIMLAATFFLTFGLELWRFLLLGRLGLKWNWQGGLRYPYYLPFVAIWTPLGAVLNTFLLWVIYSAWRSVLNRPAPLSIYLGGGLFVGVVGWIAVTTYVICRKVQEERKRLARKEEVPFPAKLARNLAFLGGLGLLGFLFPFFPHLTPFLILLGSSIFFLLSSAFLGRPIPLSGWSDLAGWLREKEGESWGRFAPREQVGVRIFIEGEGLLVRRGQVVELRGEEIAGAGPDMVRELARRMLDRARLTEIVQAQEGLRKRDDLATDLPDLIVRNLDKWQKYREGLAAAKDPQGESLSREEQEKRLRGQVRQVLDRELGTRLRSLLYWHYDLPEEEVRLFVTRMPWPDLKPMISWQEYLGLFLSVWARQEAPKVEELPMDLEELTDELEGV